MTVLQVTLLKHRKDMPKRLPGVLTTPPSGRLPCEHMRQQSPRDCLAVDTGGTRPSSCQLRHRPGEAKSAAGEDGKLMEIAFGGKFWESLFWTWRTFCILGRSLGNIQKHHDTLTNNSITSVENCVAVGNLTLKNQTQQHTLLRVISNLARRGPVTKNFHVQSMVNVTLKLL